MKTKPPCNDTAPGLLLGLFCFLGAVLPLGATAFPHSEHLQGEFWGLFDSVYPEELERPEITTVLVRPVLEEARAVFAGMIHGYSVNYIPLDRARGVEEYLVVEALGEIPWGDPDLEVLDTRPEYDLNRFALRLRYHLKDHEIRLRNSWNRGTAVHGGGSGSVPYDGREFENRAQALEAAIRESLRNYLRPREYNKPREIRALVLLRRPPYFHIDSGEIHARIQLLLILDEVREYPEY